MEVVSNTKEKIVRRLFVLFTLLMVVLTIVVLVFLVFLRKNSTTVSFTVAPSPAEILFDGQLVVNNTTINVDPGKHVVAVSFDGFEAQTQTINIGENEYKDILIVLESNDPSTADWYNTHDEDALVMQTLFSREFDEATSKMLEDYPIVENLPIHGVNYAIGYGPCSETSKEKTCIKITAQLGVRNAALVELYKNDPDKNLPRYNIIIHDYENPFDKINQSVVSNLDGLDSSSAGDLSEKILIEDAAVAFASQISDGNINYAAVERFLNSEKTVAKVLVYYGTNPNDYSQADAYNLLMAKKNGSWVPITKLQLTSTYAEYPNIPEEYIKALNTPQLD